MSTKDQELNKATESTKNNIDKVSENAQENLEKVSKSAQEEVVRLRRELDGFRQKTHPKINKIETYLTSPASYGFYQGLLVGAGLVILYSKFVAPNNKLL